MSPKPGVESRAWSRADKNAALSGAAAITALGVKHLAERQLLSPKTLLTLTTAAATLFGCDTPKPAQEIIPTPDQSLKHITGLDISVIAPSNNLPTEQQNELTTINADFITAAKNNKIFFPKNEANADEPLTQGSLVDTVTYALGQSAGSIKTEDINSAFLPNVIKFGDKGQLDIQAVVVTVDGKENVVLFGRADGENWGLISFLNQPFDVFSSSGNGIAVSGVSTMFPAFERGTSFNFTGMLIAGGKNGAIFSHALYFEVGSDGKLQLVLRDSQGTLSGPAGNNTPIKPDNNGFFNASFINNPQATPTSPDNKPESPSVETGPEGTVVQKDYLENKYTVDENGVPAYWWNSDANDGKGEWEKFQPINFTGEYVADDSKLPIVPNIIYVTSGYMEHVVTEAGLPQNPNVQYIRSTKDWEQFFSNGFDNLGYRQLKVSTEYYQSEIKSPDRYPFQPTNYTFMLKYNNQTYKVVTETLNIQTPDGEKLNKPVFFYFPESIWNNPFHKTSGKLFEHLAQLEGLYKVIGLPLIEFDPEKIDQENWKLNVYPDQKQVLEDFNAFYLDDANFPFFSARKKLLERIMNGDETAIVDISKFINPAVISGVTIIP